MIKDTIINNLTSLKTAFKQKILRNLPLWIGGFFVLICIIFVSPRLFYHNITSIIPDSGSISIILSKDVWTRLIIADYFKTIPDSNLSLASIFSIFPDNLALIVFEDSLDYGLIVQTTPDNLVRLALLRERDNLNIRPLGDHMITISTSKEFFNKIKQSPKIPWWNKIEISGYLSNNRGLIRQAIRPSNFSLLKKSNNKLMVNLPPDILNTNESTPALIQDILINLAKFGQPEAKSFLLPDKTIGHELIMSPDSPTPDTGTNEQNKINTGESDTDKICLNDSVTICF